MSKQLFIAENKEYLNTDDLACIEAMSEAAFQAVVKATRHKTGNAEPGIDCALTKTRETIADFDAARRDHWREKGARQDLSFDGFPAVFYDAVQMRGGERRASFIVIDAGEWRFIVD